jgi:hypothetical protein
MADSWDDAAQARFDEHNPPLCSSCEEREAGADGYCSRCLENLDTIENFPDVADLVRVARLHLCSSGYASAELANILDFFPLSERERQEERRRQVGQSARILRFPGA